MSRKSHWDRVYTSKAPTECSWFQACPALSLRLIEACCLDLDAGIVDVGGGASTLVDELLARGHTSVSVLDVSQAGIQHAKARLGPRAADVEWFTADVTCFEPPHQWHLWHDRAVFHFLTDEADRARYVETLNAAVAAAGYVIIATFGLEGPERCSGLDVVRYSPATLGAQLGTACRLLEAHDEVHETPSGSTQTFTYCLFRKSGS